MTDGCLPLSSRARARAQLLVEAQTVSGAVVCLRRRACQPSADRQRCRQPRRPNRSPDLSVWWWVGQAGLRRIMEAGLAIREGCGGRCVLCGGRFD
jgi:hypothetical protein